MFKVIAYLDEWEDLYVSKHASPSLRSYRGKEGVREGRDGEFVITDLGYTKQTSGERPRLVQLFTLARQPWAALLISDFLRTHAGEAMAEILKGGNRASLAKQISIVFKFCEQIDARLVDGEEPSGRTSETKDHSLPPRRRLYLWSAIPVLALVISGVLLAWTFRMRSDLQQLDERLTTTRKTYEGLQRANEQLKMANKKLAKDVSILTELKSWLELSTNRLDTTRKQLESTNINLGKEIGAQSEKMRKGQWTEMVESQIIASLKVKESGSRRDDVIKSVKANLPAMADDFIKETLRGLVDKGEVINLGMTESYGDYRLRGSSNK